MHERKREVRLSIERARTSVATISRYTEPKPSLTWGKEADAILLDVEATVRRYANEQGIMVIPTPDISLQRLLEMAVQKIRPFDEKGEKGFRDSVILFTILTKSRQATHGYHLLVSGDGVFRHDDVINLAREENVDLRQVESVSAATQHLEQFLEVAAMNYLKERASRLTDFLNQQRSEIENYIRANGDFTSTFLLQDTPFFPLTTTVEGIEEIELLEIHSARPDFLPADVDEARVKISFTAKVRFTLKLRLLRMPEFPKHRVQQRESGVEASTAFRLSVSASDEQIARRPVEKGVHMEGSVLLRRPDEYSALELERIGGSALFESLFALRSR